jgi:hypothetical protein
MCSSSRYHVQQIQLVQQFLQMVGREARIVHLRQRQQEAHMEAQVLTHTVLFSVEGHVGDGIGRRPGLRDGLGVCFGKRPAAPDIGRFEVIASGSGGSGAAQQKAQDRREYAAS